MKMLFDPLQNHKTWRSPFYAPLSICLIALTPDSALAQNLGKDSAQKNSRKLYEKLSHAPVLSETEKLTQQRFDTEELSPIAKSLMGEKLPYFQFRNDMVAVGAYETAGIWAAYKFLKSQRQVALTEDEFQFVSNLARTVRTQRELVLARLADLPPETVRHLADAFQRVNEIEIQNELLTALSAKIDARTRMDVEAVSQFLYFGEDQNHLTPPEVTARVHAFFLDSANHPGLAHYKDHYNLHLNPEHQADFFRGLSVLEAEVRKIPVEELQKSPSLQLSLRKNILQHLHSIPPVGLAFDGAQARRLQRGVSPAVNAERYGAADPQTFHGLSNSLARSVESYEEATFRLGRRGRLLRGEIESPSAILARAAKLQFNEPVTSMQFPELVAALGSASDVPDFAAMNEAQLIRPQTVGLTEALLRLATRTTKTSVDEPIYDLRVRRSRKVIYSSRVISGLVLAIPPAIVVYAMIQESRAGAQGAAIDQENRRAFSERNVVHAMVVMQIKNELAPQFSDNWKSRLSDFGFNPFKSPDQTSVDTALAYAIAESLGELENSGAPLPSLKFDEHNRARAEMSADLRGRIARKFIELTVPVDSLGERKIDGLVGALVLPDPPRPTVESQLLNETGVQQFAPNSQQSASKTGLPND